MSVVVALNVEAMDLTPAPALAPATTTTTNTPPRKSPEPDTGTATRIQPAKLLPLSNGVLKRHQRHKLAQPIVICYKECLKNHAASLGGHALDGCGEFMPSPTATHTDPTSLKCAACGCHRNFHRRDPEDSPPFPPNTTLSIEYQPHQRHLPLPPLQPPRSPNSSSPPPISSSYYPSAPHMLLALSENPTLSVPPGSRKRFRTKFSPTQKQRMLEFAQRVGWRMQKREEDSVQEFCHEIGVDRCVFKVWMHNNKNTFSKRDTNGDNDTSEAINNNNNSSSEEDLNHHHHNLHLQNDSTVALVSPSSS
ncbi:hypothetical protein K2173_019948 [Erythroxylum novogranatense]|uniref:ZF-HD dimerization-type domain-containing protein n=1 Tax=Erythroxylum novogranatense TaxID=1862640 RepID=A0AAV8UA34_9ROSI|nr:hypothetical protein K2173_019948 [Erythroxylum novogranatense]